MTPLMLTLPADREMLLQLLQPEIDCIVGDAVAMARKQQWEAAKRRFQRSPVMRQAIENVARASARVDAAHNTRDERPSIHALIAAASGLRRAVEASKKGL